MKTVFEHIETIKGHPHHIRRNIAFTSAVVGAGIIALIWLVASLGTGAFAVKGSSFADATGEGGIEASGGNNSSQVAGAAAAPAVGSASAPAHIEIVDAASSTRPAKKTEQTTIPF